MGYFHDGAPIYVGRGQNEYVWSVTPGRLTINGTMPPGVYTMAVDNETFDNKTSEYLVRNPNQVIIKLFFEVRFNFISFQGLRVGFQRSNV
jgi:hypothetical protein